MQGQKQGTVYIYIYRPFCPARIAGAKTTLIQQADRHRRGFQHPNRRGYTSLQHRK